MIEFKQLLVPAACLLMGCMPTQASEKQNYPSVAAMEKLDRGVVALPAAGKGVFISWRMLGTDSATYQRQYQWTNLGIYPEQYLVLLRP
jgi:hypothetical protein